MQNYEKYIREDGRVAVLYSPGYGAGWFSWNTKHKGLIFDKEIVQAVLDNDRELAARIAERKYKDCYTGGAEQLNISWLEPDTVFEISEYDGYESITFREAIDFIVA